MTGRSARSAYDVGHIDAAIARLASGQDGVVARAQLIALGAGPEAIKHRVRTGRLIVLYRGVYAVGHAALTDRSRARAALLVAGPGAVVSHRAAAAFLGLLTPMPPAVDVTIAGRRARRSRAGVTIHETREPPEIRMLDGIPLTGPLRTLVDLKAPERLCSEALVLRLVTEQQLQHAGLLTARTAPTRSELERRMLDLIAKAGLPRPLVNQRLGPYEVDFLWPQHRLAVETDGYAAHGHRLAFERDRARDADLQSRGYAVVRFTWRQLVDEPLRVATRTALALSARSPRPRAPAPA